MQDVLPVQSGSGGILEITVQYQALLNGVQLNLEESCKKTHVNMSVGILRATGLKVILTVDNKHTCTYINNVQQHANAALSVIHVFARQALHFLFLCQDAAVLAAQERPVPLGFAAEVGTNSFVKISIPDFLDKVSCIILCNFT